MRVGWGIYQSSSVAHLHLHYIYIYIYITLKSSSGAVPFDIGRVCKTLSLSICCSISSKPLSLFSMPSKARLSRLLLGHPVGLFIYYYYYYYYSRNSLNILIMYIISMAELFQFLTFICLWATTLSYDVAHRAVRS
jgi:hypothetical protein